MADLPNRVYELRRARGWSQQELADRAGCSKMHVSGIERGKRDFSLNMMRRMADAFGVPTADLLSPKDNPDALSEEERRLIGQLRAGDQSQREQLRKVADVIVPYQVEEPDEERLQPRKSA